MPSMLQPDQQSAAGAGRAARPKMMCAAVFVEPGRIELEDKPIPDVGPLDALLRITTTTICGTDIHILRGEYPVARGLTIGHEPVGVIEKLGSEVKGFREGQRVIAGAITPSGHSVNGGRIPGHRGGVKAGHWRWGAADMARAPIGALAISAVGIDQGMISPVSGSALSGVAWFCSAAAVARRRPADCLRR